MATKISLVVAMDPYRAIGSNNTLPWHIPEELKHFRRITLGKTVLMGRKTAESIGRALPARTNLVLTRSARAPYEDQIAVHSLAEAFEFAAGELMVIGGEQVYRMAMPYAERILVTLVDTRVENADAWFPRIDKSVFKTDHISAYVPGSPGVPGFTYMEYSRRERDRLPPLEAEDRLDRRFVEELRH